MNDFNSRVAGFFAAGLLATSIALPAQAQRRTNVPKKLPAKKAVAAKAASTETQSAPGEAGHSQSAGRVPVDARNSIRLNYNQKRWNKSPGSVDSATIFIREGATGRIVQVELEESSANSSVFSGFYSINWQNIESLKAEIYIPPQGLLGTLDGRRQITKMIESGQLRRQPFVMRKDATTGTQNIEIFESAEAARASFKNVQAQQQLLVALKNKMSDRNQVLDAARAAMEKAEYEEAQRNLAERQAIAQAELQRLKKMIEAHNALSPQERQARERLAAEEFRLAMVAFNEGRMPEAHEHFAKAIPNDPDNRDYYYNYGLLLYRVDEFNKSLVYLDLADGANLKPIERDFYRGLNFYRLKDSASAIDSFNHVVSSKDALASQASFYKGIVHYERKRWSEARTEFQNVLDTSSDPTLDQRAEAYIEAVLRAEQMETERQKRWIVSGTIGGNYDDNVILSSDSDRDRGSATNSQAYRMLFQGSARYRAIYEDDKEFAVQLDAMTMSSVDKDFQMSQTITNTDPTVVGLTLPYTHKGALLGKSHILNLTPGYETTYMSAENNEWKNIYNSITASATNLVVMDERWFMNLNLDLRQDNSLLNSSTGDNNASAIKMKLTWMNMNLISEDKKQILITDLSYTQNNALGKNSTFNRIDMGVGYVRPFWWDTTFNSKLSYFLLTYPEIATNRIDNSFTLAAGLTRPLSPRFTGGLATSYNINGSNVTANQYRKFSMLLTLTFNDAF